jgi:hypothetical protein
MERRRPNRELKNSEDVHEALIEGYFVFVLVVLFKFSSKKNISFFIYYHTKPFVWYDIFFLIVGILVQVC